MSEQSDLSLAQMDVWIEKDVKLRGDVALSRAGYTPVQAVRALWRIAVLHEDDPEGLAALLVEAEQELPISHEEGDVDTETNATAAMRNRIIEQYGTTNLDGVTFPPIPGPPGQSRA